MNEVERKYCMCLSSVQRRGYSKQSAHAICTNSVYKSRGLVRERMVACKLEKMTVVALRALAKQRGLRISQGRRYLTKPKLIKRLIYKV